MLRTLLPIASLLLAATMARAEDSAPRTIPSAPVAAAANAASRRPAEPRSVRDFGAACDGVADDSRALAAAATALRDTGGELDVPGDCRLRLAGAAQVWLQGVHLAGPGSREYSTRTGYRYGLQGGTILVDTTAAPPFLVGADWSITGLKFWWPQQTEAAAAKRHGAPAVYPPLLVPHMTAGKADSVISWNFENNQVMNAYDIADFTAATDVGHGHWEHNQEFALRYHIRVGRVGGETWIDDNQFSIIAALAMLGGNEGTRLRDYAQANAEALHIQGSGTTAAMTPQSVDGLRMAENYGFVLRYGIHIVGGALNLADITDTSWDQVETPFGVDSGGGVVATTITGGTWLSGNLDAPATATPCLVVDGAAPSNNLSMANVRMTCSGSGLEWHDSGTSVLSIVGGAIGVVGYAAARGSPPNPKNYVALDYAAPNGLLTVAAVQFLNQPANSSGAGILSTAHGATITGNLFNSFAAPVVIAAAVLPPAVVGNTSFNTQAPAGQGGVQGRAAAQALQVGNVWDTQPGTLVAAAAGLPTTLGRRSSPATVAGQLRLSTAAIVATGSRQSDAAPITADRTLIEVGAPGAGVILQAGDMGGDQQIWNSTRGVENVYPPAGAAITPPGAIRPLATGAPYRLAAGGHVAVTCFNARICYASP